MLQKIGRTTVVLLLLVCGRGVGGAQERPGMPDGGMPQLRERARTLFAARRWEESKTVWREILRRKQQRDAEAHQHIGVIEDAAGNYSAANRHLLQAVRLDPRSAQVLNNLAVNYFHLKRPLEAVRQLEKAVRLDSRSANLRFNLGSSYFDLKMFPQAVASLEQARTLTPSDAALDYKLVAAYLHVKEFVKATELWRSSTALRSAGDAAAYGSLAELFRQHEQYLTAAELYELAAKTDNQNPRLIYNRARALSLGKNYAEALVALEAIDPSKLPTPEYRRLKAEVLLKLGHLDRALVEYAAAIELSPNDPEIYLGMGAVLLDGQAFDEAITVLTKASNLFPSFPRFLIALGHAHQMKGETARATEYFRRVIAQAPDQALGYIFLGNTYLESAEFGAGVETLRQAVRAEPRSHYAHYFLARALLRAQPDDYSPIAASLRKAIALNPSFEDAYYDLGKLEMRQGNFAEAKTLLERALAINPRVGPVHYLLGQVYRRLGDYARADAAYKAHEDIRQNEQERGAAERRLIYSPHPSP